MQVLLILFVGGHLRGRAKAHPVYGSDLADLKVLLERLEDKLESEERETGLSQGLNEPNDEIARDASPDVASWDNEYSRPQSEGTFSRGEWEQSPERAPAAGKNKLRGLVNSPRSIERFSNCFGQRLDRIGSSSGLGCNRNRN
ncbi:natriuretic peptides A-like [Rhineura floridana]|uniref:natriuretic peptides A-like n=1 Tax=Rhineura floridana TaxID=261503 RepID=UPI002AC881D5|nr:natriuretic peptides A-like [Rhineura floridana]